MEHGIYALEAVTGIILFCLGISVLLWMDRTYTQQMHTITEILFRNHLIYQIIQVGM